MPKFRKKPVVIEAVKVTREIQIETLEGVIKAKDRKIEAQAKAIKQLRETISHNCKLHIAEMEGLAPMPTQQQWLEAFDMLEHALEKTSCFAEASQDKKEWDDERI